MLTFHKWIWTSLENKPQALVVNAWPTALKTVFYKCLNLLLFTMYSVRYVSVPTSNCCQNRIFLASRGIHDVPSRIILQRESIRYSATIVWYCVPTTLLELRNDTFLVSYMIMEKAMSWACLRWNWEEWTSEVSLGSTKPVPSDACVLSQFLGGTWD